jgi:hypothetical protein
VQISKVAAVRLLIARATAARPPGAGAPPDRSAHAAP